MEKRVTAAAEANPATAPAIDPPDAQS
jgi:hypothetical protein